ncbi:MAG: hypothetical protein PHV93_04100 [Candidatus Pacebacteria bacterium]|nr:hypothetical protein [Candidatus Paceibacterota bacterium]
MKYKYFVGVAHQKIHYEFLHSLLGGEFVEYPCTIFTENFSPELLKEDGEDVVWFFSDIFYHLHPLLKGKQILTKHGMTFGPYLDPGKAHCINHYFDAVFQPGLTQERKHEVFKINPEKIKPVGYLLALEMPKRKTKKDSILFASTCFRHWNHYDNLFRILGKLETGISASLSFHPYTPPNILEPFLTLIRQRKDVKLLTTQEEFLESCATSERAVSGGSGSVAAHFWFQKKPLIFLRGESEVGEHQRRVDPSVGWERVKQEIDEPRFNTILDESMKISDWREWSFEKVKKAPVAVSAEKIFYPWNWSRPKTEAKIKSVLRELEAR